MIGLLIVKPLGILTGVWLGLRLGFTIRTDDLSRRNLIGVDLLSGVGFTMFTFIAHLAFDPSRTTLESAKLAIIVVPAFAAFIAYIVLRFGSKEPRE
jgi:NhaA family Na+:H+ antiporter